MPSTRPPGVAMLHQERFHRRWPTLRDPHVRTLAWLLDAPDLLAIDAPCWDGRVATLGPPAPEVVAWLDALQQPAALAGLHDELQRHPTARLGRYAEQLLGFYLHWRQQLVAANLQVRDDGPSRVTIGEFDFLVRRPDVNAGHGLEHWEFATKFYLLQHDPAQDGTGADAFVGPNLADSLGRKMRKIMTRQLLLSQHRAAALVLPEPVTSAQALVRGWLFYAQPMRLPAVLGIAEDHCRGFWADADGWQSRYASSPELMFVPLRRLEWLAPARVPMARAISLAALLEELAGIEEPVLVAVCRAPQADDQGDAVEIERGFAVPQDWQRRAGEQVRQAVVSTGSR
ncbi:DUF1853 family protein [Herbaspirillum sp. alder98]|uniref:DUF1853 family protein n=1 Tax=Herbaspirillum sp. alder98 TaxID=2913096 RepID=UPI001CD8A4F0|nr:DUF1853 family protein [Herbaspirillum sp. alder98]MCA1323493.1 DUF1853 family protein [Herbaspirillum sp. alder98]